MGLILHGSACLLFLRASYFCMPFTFAWFLLLTLRADAGEDDSAEEVECGHGGDAAEL